MKRIAALFLLVPLLLSGCVVPYGGADATPTVRAPVADGYATLDAAGIEQIKASRVARLDMTSGRLTKESVGLESGTSQAPDVHITDGVMALDIEGPTGTISARTDRLRLNGMNTKPDFREVTYFLTAESLTDYKASRTTFVTTARRTSRSSLCTSTRPDTCTPTRPPRPRPADRPDRRPEKPRRGRVG
ncbi:hypothetical protein [Micromonospora sp. NPDC048830]|uniref:hypothetical protein n=1 Tax=Micromonospora sp. NPDC048830 TaxID=3364257 RepID=UPI003715AC3E